MTTREELIKHWKEIKAFKKGCAIEGCHQDALTGSWRTIAEPSWDKHWLYRVKCVPKKLSVWVNIYEDGGRYFHDTRKEADQATGRIVRRTACVGLTGEYEDGDRL